MYEWMARRKSIDSSYLHTVLRGILFAFSRKNGQTLIRTVFSVFEQFRNKCVENNRGGVQIKSFSQMTLRLALL